MQDDLLRFAAYTGCVASFIVFIAFGSFSVLKPVETFIANGTQTAAVFFVQSISAAQIQKEYRAPNASKRIVAPKVRILIVPGHQPDSGGTEFGGVYERDVVVDIADSLAQLLSQNPNYDVMVSRTKTAWNPILQYYFDTHAAEILEFKESQKRQMAAHVASGRFVVEQDQVVHPTTSSQASLQLFGINKYASENNIEITLHLHINDYDRRSKVGKYDGFAIYVPDPQYSNAEASKAIGKALAVRINAYHATSTMPKEDEGVVEDRELIATGSNNTADNAALLIEYGYIYEPQFQKASVRAIAVEDYAYETYLGLQDFFKDPVVPTFGTKAFPYDWDTVTVTDGASGEGVYALQSALHYLGYYPPAGKSFSDCPISGTAGPCTHSAISAYQKAQGLEATDTLGQQTRDFLAQDLSYP